MKRLIIITLFMFCCFLFACSASNTEIEAYYEEPEADEYSSSEYSNYYSYDDMDSMQYRIDELEELVEYYENEIESLIDERTDFEEQAIEAEEKVEYYENLVRQHNLPAYEEAHK